jgi:hypothetical protein
MSEEVAEPPRDPFALQTHVLHPALTWNQLGGSEYDPSLFNKFFASPAFCAWSSGTRSWQLHCYGDPGCGKVSIQKKLGYSAYDYRLLSPRLLQVVYPLR